MNSSIQFQPWIGKNYSKGLFKKKVLVLGESHYKDKAIPNDSSEFTSICVRDQISGEFTKAFWTNICATFLGHLPNPEEKRIFWHQVAFYNYIQSLLESSRTHPDDYRFQESEGPFEEVLKKHEPDFVLVLGVRLWCRLPDLNGDYGPTTSASKQNKTWFYHPSRGHSTLCYGIYHPSAAFSSDYWHKPVMEALEAAPSQPD